MAASTSLASLGVIRVNITFTETDPFGPNYETTANLRGVWNGAEGGADACHPSRTVIAIIGTAETGK
jgi:hypothetical protein